MNERKYIEEIEGLMVEILYEYEEGDSGDEFTPPTGDRVTIVSWRLLDGEKNVRNEYPDYDDEEWEEWMQDIDHYVHNDSEWDIIEFEYIQEEEQEKYDNLPEQLQDTEKGNALYESAESIEELVNRIDDLATELYDIANDIEEVTNI